MAELAWDALWAAALAGGARAMGTRGAEAAVENIVAVLTPLPCRVERHAFSYRGWILDGPISVVLAEGEKVPAAAFLGSAGTGPTPVRGRLQHVGTQRIWEGMYEWEKFGIVGPDSRMQAYVAARPDGPAIPQLLPQGSVPVPHFIVGRETLSLLHDGPTAEGILPATVALGARGVNVAATFPGQGAQRSSVLIGAHYDTVYGTPGAFDNASGVAALLALAHHFAWEPPSQTVRLVFFGAEELGLAGSRAYVDDLARREELGALMMINLDGMGRGDTLEVWPSDEGFEAWLLAHLPALPARRVTSRCPAPPGSDHAAFAERGVPSVLFTFNDLAILHHPTDVEDPRKRENTRLIVDLVRTVLDALTEEPP